MDNASSAGIGPVSQSERIGIIDSLRGFAILGILLMNIPFFGLPDPATYNPLVLHEVGTINEQVWYVISLVFDGTQRAIFSMLFGAGALLFISRVQKRSPGIAPADYFVRRQLWLVVFGLVDGYLLLWSGDILFDYGIAGIILFAFREMTPKKLLIAAGICLLLMTVRENVDLYRQKAVIIRGETIARIDTAKVKLTEQQQDELAAMKDLRDKWDTAGMKKEVAKNLRQVRGDYPTLYQNITTETMTIETLSAYSWIWDSLLFMFLGMAFFKTGFLMGQGPLRVYWWLLLAGLAAGIFLTYTWLEPEIRLKYDFYQYYRQVHFEYYEIGRALRSLGLFGLIILLYKSGWFNWLFSLMRPVGQMAFTNYLMQSILCGLFFYGIGLGMFGKLERYQIYYVVGVVWVLEIAWSHLWLRYFRFGPFEWFWRSLTYWKRQPMKRIAEKSAIHPIDPPGNL
jgi:uncharacterized protein